MGKTTLEKVLEENTLANIIVREPQIFKFDNRDNLKRLFIEAFLLVDKTVAFKEKDRLPYQRLYKHLSEYDEVIDWFCNNNGKGLFLTGSFGRGKSTILTGVLPLLFKAIHRRSVMPIHSRMLKDTDWKNTVAIDEIGKEDIKNDFGTKIDYVSNAIDYCEYNMKPLFITSNLNKQQLIDRYGVGDVERIDRLCKTIVFKGKSLRS